MALMKYPTGARLKKEPQKHSQMMPDGTILPMSADKEYELLAKKGIKIKAGDGLSVGEPGNYSAQMGIKIPANNKKNGIMNTLTEGKRVPFAASGVKLGNDLPSHAEGGVDVAMGKDGKAMVEAKGGEVILNEEQIASLKNGASIEDVLASLPEVNESDLKNKAELGIRDKIKLNEPIDTTTEEDIANLITETDAQGMLKSKANKQLASDYYNPNTFMNSILKNRGINLLDQKNELNGKHIVTPYKPGIQDSGSQNAFNILKQLSTGMNKNDSSSPTLTEDEADKFYNSDLKSIKEYENFSTSKSLMDAGIKTGLLAKNLLAKPVMPIAPRQINKVDLPSRMNDEKALVEANTASADANFQRLRERNVDPELLRRMTMNLNEQKNKQLLGVSMNETERLKNQALMNADVDTKNKQILMNNDAVNAQMKMEDNAKRAALTLQLLSQIGGVATGYGMSRVKTSDMRSKAGLMKYLLKTKSPNEVNAIMSLFDRDSQYTFKNRPQTTVSAENPKED